MTIAQNLNQCPKYENVIYTHPRVEHNETRFVTYSISEGNSGQIAASGAAEGLRALLKGSAAWPS